MLFYGSENISPQNYIRLALVGIACWSPPDDVAVNTPKRKTINLGWVEPQTKVIYGHSNISQFKLLAALSLIARRWPKISGSRNDFALAVSQYLHVANFHEQRKDIIYLIALAAR